MAILTKTESSTVRVINAAREAEHVHWDSIGLGMSELGSECDRALWYSFRWASQEALTARKLRIFESGNVYEKRMIADLKRVPGIVVCDVDPDTGKQIKVYAIGGHFRGKLDATALGIPEATATWHVVECKSHNDASFKLLVKKKLKESKPGHWWQCQMYMHLLSLTRCLYYAENKNDDEIYTERVDYDQVACMQMMARLENIITQTVAPTRISENPGAFACMFCKHKAVCRREDFGRLHCRSCMRSTPIVDHASTDATWLCEKWGKPLSVDDQRAGCHAHLFHPDFVPGEQVDAGEIFVTYIVDGKRWTNQEKDPPPTPEPPKQYWWHAESSSLFTSDGIIHPGDGCEELSAQEYAEAQEHFLLTAGDVS